MDRTDPDAEYTKDILVRVLLVLITCFSIGAVFYHYVEDFVWVDAIYMSAMTITTVGYGDFVPTTVAGKIFTAIYAFVGIGLFFGLAATIFHHGVVRPIRRRRENALRKQPQAKKKRARR